MATDRAAPISPRSSLGRLSQRTPPLHVQVERRGPASAGAPHPREEERRDRQDARRRRGSRRSGTRGGPCPSGSRARARRSRSGAPHERRDRRQHRVAAERELEHAGGDRDEGAHQRRQPAEEHERGAVALEPALGAREALRPEMQPAPVALDQRAARPTWPIAHRRSSRRDSRARRGDHREQRRTVWPAIAPAASAPPNSITSSRRRQHGVEGHQHEDAIRPWSAIQLVKVVVIGDGRVAAAT